MFSYINRTLQKTSAIEVNLGDATAFRKRGLSRLGEHERRAAAISMSMLVHRGKQQPCCLTNVIRHRFPIASIAKNGKS